MSASSCASASGYCASSSRSRPIWYSKSSRCERTDTYSPAAIANAPAASPATPEQHDDARIGARARDAEDQARVRHEAVVDAEHRGAQVAAAAETAVPVLDAARRGGRRVAGVVAGSDVP